MNNTSAPNEASRIVVAANAAASIEVPAGAAIQCVRGKLWLTQEGDMGDHVVPAGMMFCTDRPGRVVVSAIDGESVVVVRRHAPGDCAPGAVTVDSIERFTHAARQAQAEYMAGLFAGAIHWVKAQFTKAVRPSTSLPAKPVLSWSKGSGRTDGFCGYVRSL